MPEIYHCRRIKDDSGVMRSKDTTHKIDELIRSKRKTIAIIVKPDGSVIVRAPLRASLKSIREFVYKNIQWIKRKKAAVETLSPPVPRQYLPGELFLFLGNSYPLEIVEEQKQGLVLDGRFKLAQTWREDAALAFESWYREQARQYFRERIHYYSGLYGFHYKKIGITSAQTRWGSCSADGSLNFSWRLIMAPGEVVDYVVIHELVHTRFHNHSREFWSQVQQIMPEYREHRKWLKENGQRLML